MRVRARLAVLGSLVVLGAAGVGTASPAVAGCNESTGTIVCAQGDIRGTSGKPPAAPIQGAWGSWCSGGICYPGYAGFFGVWP